VIAVFRDDLQSTLEEERRLDIRNKELRARLLKARPPLPFVRIDHLVILIVFAIGLMLWRVTHIQKVHIQFHGDTGQL
jgi:hypothetical protein